MTLREMKWYERAVYALGKFYAIFLTTFLFPLKVQGRENLPKSGPFIIIANHISMLEVFFIPRILMPLRTVFMAKSELFSHGAFLSWVLRVAGGFPVKRGTADIGAIKQSLEVLKAGDVFAIFPEGTRNRKLDGNLQKFFNGIGYIALLSGAPVIPMLFADTGGFKLFRRVRVVVGPPVSVAELRDKGKLNGVTTEKATKKVLNALNELLYV
jgi:1-acyl-sn-glycerol-3-phosphate acyltransferase